MTDYGTSPNAPRAGNIRECRMRAKILIALAKDAPELENQLLLRCQKMAAARHFKGAAQRRADRVAHKLSARH
jgi:hypothetical protein